MPYADGGYAADHSQNTAPKDEDDKSTTNTTTTPDIPTSTSTIASDKPIADNHVDTLIDAKGLPPVPHPYWVDRLGFQQTDPVTDFRSGGVLSLAMLLHIVESCPNVHARFLPSGDAHMLPFGITCINVTDMIAKFCMFSKNVDRMDVLMSQKPFWRMFADPNSLLVMQELCMDMLCNVVVELGRERKLPKVDKRENGFQGQEESQKVTVFDFAEILEKTEKRVHDDLLGGGPRSVDELRSIFSRITAKYSRAMDKKESAAIRQVQRSMEKGEGNAIDKFSLLSSDPVRATMAMTETMIDSSKIMTENVIGLSGNVIESTKSISGSVFDSTKVVTGNVLDKTKVVTGSVLDKTKVVRGNVMDGAGGVMSKFKDDFGFRSKRDVPSSVDGQPMEEIDFAMPPKPSSQHSDTQNELIDLSQDDAVFVDKNVTNVTTTTGEEKEVSIEKNDLADIYDFLDETPDADEASGFFTIDDEDFDV